MQFDAVEKSLVRHCIVTISIQFLFFWILLWFIGRDGSLIAPLWLCALVITGISAFCEIFWRLVPSLRYHRRNKQVGGSEYRAKVEAAIEHLGARKMLYQHWFVRELDDILNERKL